MDSDDRNDTPGQIDPLEQATATAALNNTDDFLENENELDESVFNEEQILDEFSREYLIFGFKKMAKKNDYILIEELGDAFRHAGQNPAEDTIKDMVEKARALKDSSQAKIHEKVINDHLSYPEYLSIVHEYWCPSDEDRQHLDEAFETLDPKRTENLMVDDFTSLLRDSDWPEDEIDLILSQVNCADGYFLYDDLAKLLLTPVELPEKKSAKPKSSDKKKKSAS